MIYYIIALIGVFIIAYMLKVRASIKAMLAAFVGFVIANFIWGYIAEAMDLTPSDMVSALLYSLVGFALFWIIYIKWIKPAVRE